MAEGQEEKQTVRISLPPRPSRITMPPGRSGAVPPPPPELASHVGPEGSSDDFPPGFGQKTSAVINVRTARESLVKDWGNQVKNTLGRELYDSMVVSTGRGDYVEEFVTRHLGLVFNRGLSREADFVASSIGTWRLIYPESRVHVLKAIFSAHPNWFEYAGEGVVIGLLDLYRGEANKDDIFRALAGTYPSLRELSLIKIMQNARVTKGGAGLLSNALSGFISPLESEIMRAPPGKSSLVTNIFTLLRVYKGLVIFNPRERPLVQSLDFILDRFYNNFFEYFVAEFVKKTLIAAGPEFGMNLLNEYAEKLPGFTDEREGPRKE